MELFTYGREEQPKMIDISKKKKLKIYLKEREIFEGVQHFEE